MRGTVRLINREDKIVAVETEAGGFTVFGMLDDCAVAVGDTISGALDQLDQQQLSNETQGGSMSVYIEDCNLSEADATPKVG